MPATTYHDIQFRAPVDLVTDLATGPMQMWVYVKNLLSEDPPDAPDFGEDFTLADTVDKRESDYPRGNRTTIFKYDYPEAWGEPEEERVSDASLPYTPPDNVYTFEYKDYRDDSQGYTRIIWFVIAEGV